MTLSGPHDAEWSPSVQLLWPAAAQFAVCYVSMYAFGKHPQVPWYLMAIPLMVLGLCSVLAITSPSRRSPDQ
jgi:hypothetical protein